jgi:hypothetical protein
MNKFLLTCCTFLVALTCMHAVEPENPGRTLEIEKQPSEETFISAIKVPIHDLNSLSLAYQIQHKKATWGGRFSKSAVQELLNSMPSSSKLIHFRFCKDPSLGATCLMLCGDKKVTHPTSYIRCLRNGGRQMSICPAACNINDKKSPNSIVITYEDYLAFSESFQKANKRMTFGGNIDKFAIQEIINSLPHESNNVSFLFCTDSVFHHTSVIFIGGLINQPNNTILSYRNGLTTNSFCPTNCNTLIRVASKKD